MLIAKNVFNCFPKFGFAGLFYLWFDACVSELPPRYITLHYCDHTEWIESLNEVVSLVTTFDIYSIQTSYRLNKMSLGNLKAFAIPILIAIYHISGNSKSNAVRIGIANALGFLEHYFFISE